MIHISSNEFEKTSSGKLRNLCTNSFLSSVKLGMIPI
jgi:hypothetical protein